MVGNILLIIIILNYLLCTICAWSMTGVCYSSTRVLVVHTKNSTLNELLVILIKINETVGASAPKHQPPLNLPLIKCINIFNN